MNTITITLAEAKAQARNASERLHDLRFDAKAVAKQLANRLDPISACDLNECKRYLDDLRNRFDAIVQASAVQAEAMAQVDHAKAQEAKQQERKELFDRYHAAPAKPRAPRLTGRKPLSLWEAEQRISEVTLEKRDASQYDEDAIRYVAFIAGQRIGTVHYRYSRQRNGRYARNGWRLLTDERYPKGVPAAGKRVRRGGDNLDRIKVEALCAADALGILKR